MSKRVPNFPALSVGASACLEALVALEAVLHALPAAELLSGDGGLVERDELLLLLGLPLHRGYLEPGQPDIIEVKPDAKLEVSCSRSRLDESKTDSFNIQFQKAEGQRIHTSLTCYFEALAFIFYVGCVNDIQQKQL